MGAGKLLRVMGGDKLHVKVDYYTPDVTTSNPGPNGLTTVINSLLSVINGNNSFDPIKGEGSAITTSLNGSSVFTSFLSPQSTSQGSTMPKAYLNILFFDEQFRFVSSGSESVQISVKGSGQTIVRASGSAKEALKNGYVYIYVNNESENDVYFDNLQISHERGQILEEMERSGIRRYQIIK